MRKYPAGFAFATVQELSDIVDGLAVASEELRYRQELTDDYEPEDRAEMLAKAERIDALYARFMLALNGAASQREAIASVGDEIRRVRSAIRNARDRIDAQKSYLTSINRTALERVEAIFEALLAETGPLIDARTPES
jgi:hypothetical protein